MAREINRLSARKVQALSEPGRHADGGSLYLVIDPSGSKRWVVLYRMQGRRREMGLGSVNAVSLARARELAGAARAQISEGIGPIEARASAVAPPPPPAPVTFADVAETYMADRERTWRNAAHRAQWRQTLEVQAASLWRMPVTEIGTDDVLAVLRPMWHEKAETARRIRGCIERVLDAARVGGHRSGENPARWRGHLEVLLPRSRKLTRGHHKAMPYAEVPAFYAAVAAGRTSASSLALRFTILTAARSGETRGLVWSEVDMAAALWTVPAERMKAGRQHRVPLSAPALAILASVRPDYEPATPRARFHGRPAAGPPGAARHRCGRDPRLPAAHGPAVPFRAVGALDRRGVQGRGRPVVPRVAPAAGGLAARRRPAAGRLLGGRPALEEGAGDGAARLRPVRGRPLLSQGPVRGRAARRGGEGRPTRADRRGHARPPAQGRS